MYGISFVIETQPQGVIKVVNLNKSYYRDTSMKSLGNIQKIGVVRYRDNYKQIWQSRNQAKRLSTQTSLKPSLSKTHLSVKN